MVGDPIAAMWLLAWTPHAITHGLNPLYTTLLNFPVGVNLAWNPTAPLLGLLSWPALLVGGPILQYNAALTFGVAATAWAGYLAACLRVRRRWLAVLGGLLFGMSPYVVGQALSHPALAVVPGVPLVAVAVEQAWFRHTWGPVRAGAALAGAVLVVLLVSEEVFGSMLIAGGLVLLGCGWTWRASWRLWLPRVLRTSAVAALLVAPVLVGLLVVQFGWPGRILGQPLPPAAFSGDLASLVIPNVTAVLAYPPWSGIVASFSNNPSEAGLYVGVPFLALLLFAWRGRWLEARSGPWLSLLGVAAVLALGPTLHVWVVNTGIPLPARVLGALPVARDLVPVRFSLYVGLAVAMIVPAILDHVRSPSRRASWARWLAVVGVLSWVPFAPIVSTVTVPSLFTAGAIPRGSVVLFGPADVTVDNDAPMLWQASAGFRFRTPAAYVVGRELAFLHPGNLPPFERSMLVLQEHGRLGTPSPTLRRAVHVELERDRVTMLAVGPMPHEVAARSLVSDLVGAPGSKVGGVWVWNRPRAGWPAV